jgi:hypothetical protein
VDPDFSSSSADETKRSTDPLSAVLTPPPSPTPFAVVFKNPHSRPSFKQFCTKLSERFLRGSEEARLQDTSAYAVRLAVALLRPWLHRSLPKADTDDVARTVGELALVIAQWPAQWWARDRHELDGLVRAMVSVVAEEVAETRRVHALREVERMERVVAGLQDDLAARQRPPPYSSRWTSGPLPPLQPLPTPPPEKSYSLPPVTSALISGLLFGSFCMLSIISSQRWELANHLT